MSRKRQSAHPCDIGLLLNYDRILNADDSNFTYLPAKTFRRPAPRTSFFSRTAQFFPRNAMQKKAYFHVNCDTKKVELVLQENKLSILIIESSYNGSSKVRSVTCREGTECPFAKLGARRECVVNATSLPLYPRSGSLYLFYRRLGGHQGRS